MSWWKNTDVINCFIRLAETASAVLRNVGVYVNAILRNQNIPILANRLTNTLTFSANYPAEDMTHLSPMAVRFEK